MTNYLFLDRKNNPRSLDQVKHQMELDFERLSGDFNFENCTPDDDYDIILDIAHSILETTQNGEIREYQVDKWFDKLDENVPLSWIYRYKPIAMKMLGSDENRFIAYEDYDPPPEVYSESEGPFDPDMEY